MPKAAGLVQGTLGLMILRTLEPGAMHGWAIAQRIQAVSREQVQVRQGALYPALHRLEKEGWIRAQWGESENRRRARYYALTGAGRKVLERERAQWQRLAAGIGLVLGEGQG